MRNLKFAPGELYHIYNRGVDKRDIFPSIDDLERFFLSMSLLNNSESIGSVNRKGTSCRHGVSTGGPTDTNKLVRLIAYCLNPNHFHLIIEPLAEKGVERFMHKLGMAHSKYINTKYKRSGALFQGSFKAIHIDSNEYLLYLSAYVNLNNRAHGYRHGVSTKSSWDEYVSDQKSLEELCTKEIILTQFDNREAYRKFADEALENIISRKELLAELENEEVDLVSTI